MSAKTKRPGSKRAVKIERGSGNVFADLALGDADERLAKAELANEICALIAAAGLSQRDAARRLGVDQPKISAILRGRLKDFSTGRLMRFLTLLNRDVVIVLRDPEDERHPSVR